MPLAMVLSVNDIQGQWNEMNGSDMWEVNGIVAEKTTVSKGQRKRPIVLNDGPDGVMWGSGNLTGNMENGVLVWRNRRGEVSYCWEKGAEKTKGMPQAKKTGVAKARPNPVSVPPPSSTNSMEKLTPRSTASGMSSKTTEIMAEIGNSAMSTNITEEQPDEVALAEMQMFMEMARSR